MFHIGTLQEDEALQYWATLDQAIEQIYMQNASNLSFDDLYHLSYKLIINRYGDMVYQNVQITFKRIMNLFLNQLQESSGDILISKFISIFDQIQFLLKIVCHIFLYMERNYIEKNNLNSVAVLGYEIFIRELFYSNKTIFSSILEQILLMIQNERQGIQNDYFKLKRSAQIIRDIGKLSANTYNPYETHLEKSFLNSSELFYKQESINLMNNMNIQNYILQIEARYHVEQNKILLIFEKTTQHRLMNLFFNYYLGDNLIFWLDGFSQLIDIDAYACIKKLFILSIQQEQTFQQFLNVLQNYIQKNIEQIFNKVQCEKQDISQITIKMIQFKNKIELMVQNSFIVNDIKINNLLKETIKNSCEISLNKTNKIILSLTKYIDFILKNDLKQKNDLEIENCLTQIIEIFKLIRDKDIFETIYRQFFIKRIVSFNVIENELEKLLITKFNQISGNQFMSKIQLLLQEKQISDQVIQNFRYINIFQIQLFLKQYSIYNLNMIYPFLNSA